MAAIETNLFGKLSGKDAKKVIPGHVTASINWNRLKKIYGDHYSMPIQDGAKVIVCKLKPNPSGLTSVAYPVDELNLPKWFKELPFDDESMESVLIDKKIPKEVEATLGGRPEGKGPRATAPRSSPRAPVSTVR